MSMYENALDGANLDKYRQIDARSKLYFEGGVIVELLSGQEMANKGLIPGVKKASW